MALIISTAAGAIVYPCGTDEDAGEQMVTQLFNNPRVMWPSAGVLGSLGLYPWACRRVLRCSLLFTVALASLGWVSWGEEKQRAGQRNRKPARRRQHFREANKVTEATWTMWWRKTCWPWRSVTVDRWWITIQQE
ncbi:FHIPEP family type III secretion protein [Shigella flexneri]